MVRPAETRIKKYKAKVDADVVRSRISAYGEEMKTLQEVKQAEVTDVQNAVRSILDNHGINPVFTMPYMACALEVYRIIKKYSGTTKENEAKIALDKWFARGCNGEVLADIASYFGISWSPPS